MSRLEIFIDPYSAPSYLALRPTTALCRELNVDVTWHPFRAPPERRPSPADDGDVRSRHQRVRQAYRDHDYARYAAWQGLPFHRPAPPADRDLVDLAILLAGTTTDAADFLIRLADRLWDGTTFTADAASLSTLLGRPDFATLSAQTGADELAAWRARVEPLGIFDAPAYLIDGELFIGRQHLPAIRQLLTQGNPFNITPHAHAGEAGS